MNGRNVEDGNIHVRIFPFFQLFVFVLKDELENIGEHCFTAVVSLISNYERAGEPGCS